jgi:hypothetical protein
MVYTEGWLRRTLQDHAQPRLGLGAARPEPKTLTNAQQRLQGLTIKLRPSLPHAVQILSARKNKAGSL